MNKHILRIVIPCRFGYLNCWQPGNNNGGKYSISAIIDKNDTDTVKKIRDAIDEVITNNTQIWGGKIPPALRSPLHDGDEEKSENSIYKNSLYINAKSKTKPEIVDRNIEPIKNQTEVYSGCYGNVSLTLYPYNFSGNRGIAASLGNIQKIQDGEPLFNVYSAKQDFSGTDNKDFLN